MMFEQQNRVHGEIGYHPVARQGHECKARSPLAYGWPPATATGYYCTRARGHSGDHAAHGASPVRTPVQFMTW